jgi:outer membrane protein OmpA-like peptidoglycan-associated protein
MKINKDNVIESLKSFGVKTKGSVSKISEGKLFFTGIVPIITSILSSTIIFFCVLLICLIVGPAKHIIMSDFAHIDPTSTTFLIGLYCFLVTSIYYNEKSQLTESDKSQVTSVLKLLQYFAAVSPLVVWLLFLAYNECLSKIYSFVVTTFFIVVITLIHLDILKISQNVKPRTSFLYMLYICLVVLLYNISIYELDAPWRTGNMMNDDHITSHNFLSAIGGLGFGLLLYYYCKNKQDVWPLILLVGVLISGLLFSLKGAIHALDVLLIYTIFIRLLVYFLGYTLSTIKDIFTLIKKLLEGGKIYMDFIWISVKTMPIILLILLLFKTKQSIIHNISPNDGMRDTLTMEQYITDWILKREYSSEPIVIIAGQGGGSRAGCAFLSTIGLLDTVSTIQDNILALTTISGSSAGAGFYLSTKELAQDSLRSTSFIKKLYTKDYISEVLFKLLFIDPLYGILPKNILTKWNLKGRNSDLTLLEQKALVEALGSKSNQNKTFIAKKWSEAYSGGRNTLPLFMPATYNINHEMKALSVPYTFYDKNGHKYFSILDSLGQKNKEITIGESILLSELFPLVNANAIVDSSMYIDGGVYDNYGFETLLDLYDKVSKIRYKIAPKKSVLIIPILNSAINGESHRLNYKHSLVNVGSAVTKTIFTSYPEQNLERLKAEIESNGDHFQFLEIYPKEKNKNKKSKVDYEYLFKYRPDSTKIMMSRYLHWQEIEKIHGLAKEEINKKIIGREFHKKQHELYFDFNSYTIEREAKLLMKNIKPDCENMCLEIQGFADNRGNTTTNKNLAWQRAKAIKKYIEKSLKVDVNGISISIGQHPQYKEGIFERVFDRKCTIKIDTI